MKKKIFLATILGSLGIIGLLWAADHIDAPAVTGKSTDITDFYVFQGSDENNLVFVVNTQGLLSPSATAGAQFDPNTLLEFNIDHSGDNVEDLVIQAIYEDGMMKFYGPATPSSPGNISQQEGDVTGEVNVTPYGSSAVIGSGENGMSLFAGPRDDPFFFDLTQYQKIIDGEASGFNDPGTDTFAGTNVLSVVVEIPKSMLGSNDMLNVWVESKSRM